ncbi:Uncharacterized protein pbN1_04470 [Aromatoleum bremense]|nr:Uncharacterized protein pbN1_04470 [Aromatoleum bremense]
MSFIRPGVQCSIRVIPLPRRDSTLPAQVAGRVASLSSRRHCFARGFQLNRAKEYDGNGRRQQGFQ